jgi:hypothetical protein
MNDLSFRTLKLDVRGGESCRRGGEGVFIGAFGTVSVGISEARRKKVLVTAPKGVSI